MFKTLQEYIDWYKENYHEPPTEKCKQDFCRIYGIDTQHDATENDWREFWEGMGV